MKIIKNIVCKFLIILIILITLTAVNANDTNPLIHENRAPELSDDNIYISPTGLDSGNGSRENPYGDFNLAINNLNTSKNNTIILLDGTYTRANNIQSTISASNLTIKADTGANPVFDFENNYDRITLTECSNIVIEGISFKNYYGTVFFLYLTNNTLISNCAFNGGSFTTIQLNNAINTKIEYSKFNNNYNNISNNYCAVITSSYDSHNLILTDNEFINNSFYYGVLYLQSNETLIENNTFINNNAFNNGGALTYFGSNMLVLNNTFINNTANNRGGAIYLANSKNTTFENLTLINNKATEGGAIYVDTSQNTFSNNSTNITVNNSLFINNTADIGGGLVILTPNSTVSNTIFLANNASKYGGGGLIINGENTLVNNCTFINNTGLNYAGALSTNDTYVNNSLFINNTAYHGGSILTINSTIENTIFQNNTGNFTVLCTYYETVIENQTINTNTSFNYPTSDYTITVENFPEYDIINITNSEATILINTTSDKYTIEDFTDYKLINVSQATIQRLTQNLVTKNNISSNILALTDYTLINTTLPSNTAYYFNSTRILNVIDNVNGRFYLNDTENLITHIGYCVEENASAPYNVLGSINGTSGIEIQDLDFIRNSIDQSYVGDYIKILVAYYQPTIFNLKEQILTFTDRNYTNSTDPIIRDVIQKYNNGTRVRNGEEIRINDTVTCYYFSSFISPTTRQNLILINSCAGVLIKPDLNVTKTALNTTVYRANDIITYNITVKNTNTYTLHNVTLREEQLGPLEFVGWESQNDGYSWSQVSSLMWRLNNPLEANQETGITIYMKVIESAFPYVNSVTNRIHASSYETNEKYDDETVNVKRSGLQVVKTPVKQLYSYSTSGFDNRINFTINITNIGSLPISNIVINDTPEHGLTPAGHESRYPFTQFGETQYRYSGTLRPGESITINLLFTPTFGVNKTYYNYVLVSGSDGSIAEDNTTVNVTSPIYSLSLNKTALNKTVVLGEQMEFLITVTNNGTESLDGFRVNDTSVNRTYWGYFLPDVLAEEKGLIFDYAEIGQYWITQGPPGETCWVYGHNLLPGETTSPIHLYFNTTRIGNVTNYANLTWHDYRGSYNDSDNDTIEVLTPQPNMTVEKICLNKTVYQNELVTFLIIVNNTGNLGLKNVYVNETSFEGLEYKSYSSDENSSWTKTENCFYLETLGYNKTALLYITFNATKIGNLTNIITAGSNQTNTSIANNTTEVIPYIPNMSISKVSINPNSILNGNANFLIRVFNTGTVNLTNITVKEDNFHGLKYLYYTTNDNWIFDENTMVWTLDNLEVGKSSNILVTFQTLEVGILTNTIVVNSNETNTANTSNITTVHEEQPHHPDHISNISVIKIALNNTVYENELVTFQITVNNTGDRILYDAYVTEMKYDEGLEFLYFTGDDWHHELIESRHLFIHYNLLKPNETSTFYVTFNTTSTGFKTNTVTVGFNHTDLYNTTANLTVLKRPDVVNFTITKIALTSNITLGEQAIFQIIVNNTGNIPITNITVYELYDTSLILDSYENINGNWTLIGNNFYLNDEIKPGELKSFKVFFNTTSIGDKINSVFLIHNGTVFDNSLNNTLVITNNTNNTNNNENNNTSNNTNNTNNPNIPQYKPVNSTNNSVNPIIPKETYNTGNPIILFIMALAIIGLSPIRRKK